MCVTRVATPEYSIESPVDINRFGNNYIVRFSGVILSQVNIFDIFGHLTKLRYFGFRQHAEGLKSTLP